MLVWIFTLLKLTKKPMDKHMDKKIQLYFA